MYAFIGNEQQKKRWEGDKDREKERQRETSEIQNHTGAKTASNAQSERQTDTYRQIQIPDTNKSLHTTSHTTRFPLPLKQLLYLSIVA